MEASDIPSFETVSQGSGGNMNAAFWIWSAISSSSLNGNVPLRLHVEWEHGLTLLAYCARLAIMYQRSYVHLLHDL